MLSQKELFTFGCPCSSYLLHRLLLSSSAVCFFPDETLLFKVAFSLCFFGAFWFSKLLPKSSSKMGGLLISDVCMGSTFVWLLLQYSKTDQLSKGRRIVVHQLPGSSVCAFSLLSQYLLTHPLVSNQLLVHSSGLPLTQYQFSAVPKKMLAPFGFTTFTCYK